MGSEVAVVVNPIAGHGRARRSWPTVAKALSDAGLDFDASLTGGPGDASRLAAEAVRAGYRTVVAIGGDGTLNEVVNGLVATESTGEFRARLGIISCGSGCDFVRSLGIPRGADGVPILSQGQSRPIDVGRVSFRAPDGEVRSRCFVNAADLGLGAEVARRVNRSSKRLGGFLSFFAGAATSILKSRPWDVEYALDDEPARDERAGLVFVANGRFAGGNMLIAPEARLDDGLFDVVILREVPRTELLFGLFPRVYRGTHVGHPQVVYRRASKVVVSSPQRLGLEIDGELPGAAPAEFTVLPGALEVIAPAGLGRTRAQEGPCAEEEVVRGAG